MLIDHSVDRDGSFVSPVSCPGRISSYGRSGIGWHIPTLRYTMGYCRQVTRTPEWSISPAIDFGSVDRLGRPAHDGRLEQTLELSESPGWAITLTIGPEGTVERLLIEPSPVKDNSPRQMLVCRHCGNDVAELDSRKQIRRQHSRRWPRTRPGPTPVGGITTRMLRKITLQELATDVRSSGANELAGHHKAARAALAPDSPILAAIVDTLASNLTNTPRPGRRGRDELDYARLAYLYVQALISHPKNPVKEVARVLYISPSRVRDMLHEARARDLLSRPTAPGIPGGELLPKARDLLGIQSGVQSTLSDGSG